MKKKFFSKKIFSKNKLKGFLDKEGFYVVLFLCIAIIATTAVYVTRNNMDYFSQNNGENNQISENMEDHEFFQPEELESLPKDPGKEPPQEDKEASLNTDKKEEVKKEETKKEEVKKEEPKATAVVAQNPPAKSNTKSEATISLKNPVKENSITMDYSYKTKPVFSATLNEFRSDHMGVDIQGAKGEEVKAAQSGKVIEIIEDARLGKLVTIDHGGGFKTKYGNLSKEIKVTKNQQVKAGQVLGTVGNTALFEIEDDPHVHFEVWKGDKPQDPKTYLKNLKCPTE